MILPRLKDGRASSQGLKHDSQKTKKQLIQQ
jgi:hypothetical protein